MTWAHVTWMRHVTICYGVMVSFQSIHRDGIRYCLVQACSCCSVSTPKI